MVINDDDDYDDDGGGEDGDDYSGDGGGQHTHFPGWAIMISAVYVLSYRYV